MSYTEEDDNMILILDLIKLICTSIIQESENLLLSQQNYLFLKEIFYDNQNLLDKIESNYQKNKSQEEHINKLQYNENKESEFYIIQNWFEFTFDQKINAFI